MQQSSPQSSHRKRSVWACLPQVESGRYHVYIGNACPWCHRVLLALIVRGLLPHISYTVAADDPERASRGGWVFDTPEPVFGRNDLRSACHSRVSYRPQMWTTPLIISSGSILPVLARFSPQTFLLATSTSEVEDV